MIRPSFSCLLVGVLLGCFIPTLATAAAETSRADYAAVEAVFSKHCLDCHAAQDPEAKLVLESYADFLKGGESGAAFVTNKSADSLLVKMVEGNFERDGKKKIMPPGKRKKLEASEIAALKGWIDAGAPSPKDTGRPAVRELALPKVAPKVPPRRAIQAIAYAPGAKLIAVARYGEVELRLAETRALTRTLIGHRGSVNAVAFSADGAVLAAAAGQPGMFGEVRLWKVADGSLLRVIEGHRDALYSVAISPDGKTLATGSYDQKIKLWKLDTGEELQTLAAHNGAIFDLAFRPDGKVLASASGDRTIKLWDVASGKRLDTLNQPLKEQYAVAFSADGRRLVAGGVDNRIRVWEISEKAVETTNPLLEARFAHEGAVLNLVFSPDGKTLLSSADDRTVKLWNADTITERLSLAAQPDVPPALAFLSEGKTVAVGRLDGSLEVYDAATGKVQPPAKPELSRLEPRGLQRGTTQQIKLTGKHLAGLKEVKFSNTNLTGTLVASAMPNDGEIILSVTATSGLERATHELFVVGEGGESGRLKLHVDDLPQVYESATNGAAKLPVSFWGAIEKANGADSFEFEAKAGQQLVFDLAAKSLGSKASTLLTLLNADGRVIASDNGLDSGDPLMTAKVPAAGRYRVRVNEQALGASPEHFYRLSVGAFPFVTGIFPMGARTNSEVELQLAGYNLAADARIKLKTGNAGEMDVPFAAGQFRSRRGFKLLVTDANELVESEPNDTPADAMKISVPAVVNGRVWKMAAKENVRDAVERVPPGVDADVFRFDAKAGQAWVIETQAAQRGSPIDTKIEVLHADGKPVQRLLLQAVRNSAVTFRGIDSTTLDCRVENWEEMELNQLLYLQGEVVKLFRAPQGPDSGFNFYSGAGGKRRCYFDTSATAHALDEPCYIVEPHPPGAKVVANGLPVFLLNYANDDDGERNLGADSKLIFTAPADGAYLVRVTDARGFGGDRFTYRLVIREPRPDFSISLGGANPTVLAGSGQSFSVSAERTDGFEGEIKIEITNLPPGFSVSTPLMIQAGHTSASGTLFAAEDAPKPAETNANQVQLTATAMIAGQPVTKSLKPFGTIKLGEKPKLFVALESGTVHATPATNNAVAGQPIEITLVPGQAIPAWLKVKRNGYEDLITFSVENLPHGVIVDNIGLNGVLMPKGETEREIFLAAAKWVPDTDRLCYAIENQAGRQTSRPVWIKVRRPGGQIAAGK